MNKRFFRNQRLKLASDFRRLSEDSVYKVVTEFFVLKILPNQLSFSRIGIITSKRVGCAVERNRARRIIREIFRTAIQSRYGTYDLLVIVRPAILQTRFIVVRDKFLSSMEEYFNKNSNTENCS
ncbi:MAG: ribonuclease P protein component [Opitutales bacterium]|nr:ribonuclease P protein component [Opitutales bacterium]